VEDFTVNVLAYADDITLISNRAPDLQAMIDKCEEYARKWRFNYGIKKSKCMTMQSNTFINQPSWYLGNCELENVDQLEILGVTYTYDSSAKAHINNRIRKCSAAYYSMAGVGISYPGLSSQAKSHMWKTACLPSLIYGLDTLATNKKDMQIVSSTQGSLIKRSMGLSRTHHHSHLLQALNIRDTADAIKSQSINSFYNIMNSDTPAKELQLSLLVKYVVSGKTVTGSIIDSLVKYGVSPIKAALYKPTTKCRQPQDGVIDSLRQIVYSENYVKRWSYELLLTSLLTKSF